MLVNTCAIREHAELKVFSKTGGLKKIKEKNPDMIVMLCGCMAQEPHVGEKIKKSYPYVDVVFGTDKNHRLPELILDRLSGGDRNFCVSDLPHGEFGVICENTPVTRRSSYKAWVSIMYGCNNYCTYCIVPYVRGRERSRRPEDVLDEIKRLADAGYKDITLLGQNVNSYDGGISFPELLRRASGFSGVLPESTAISCCAL
ncbi:tRNA-i(6)A37 thiotransferase enzyme MiaB [Ruminococcus sp. CAG:382]|nr:tRNA-i(6)A37 thiotransferase enzyme MiaB [Ruminococcus sp. CAG:382]